MISTYTVRSSMHFNDVFEEIQNSLCMIIIMGTDANDKMGITVNEAVKDDLPSNKTCGQFRWVTQKFLYSLPYWPSWCHKELGLATL